MRARRVTGGDNNEWGERNEAQRIRWFIHSLLCILMGPALGLDNFNNNACKAIKPMIVGQEYITTRHDRRGEMNSVRCLESILRSDFRGAIYDFTRQRHNI